MKSAFELVATSRRSELTLRNPSQFHVREMNSLHDSLLSINASDLESKLSGDSSLKDFQVHHSVWDHQDFLQNHQYQGQYHL